MMKFKEENRVQVQDTATFATMETATPVASPMKTANKPILSALLAIGFSVVLVGCLIANVWQEPTPSGGLTGIASVFMLLYVFHIGRYNLRWKAERYAVGFFDKIPSSYLLSASYLFMAIDAFTSPVSNYGLIKKGNTVGHLIAGCVFAALATLLIVVTAMEAKAQRQKNAR